MIHQQCPLCGHDLTLDEQRYKAGSTIIRQCPQCGSDVEFTITNAVDTSSIANTTDMLWKEELRRQLQELEALRAMREKDDHSADETSESRKKKKSNNRLTFANIIAIIIITFILIITFKTICHVLSYSKSQPDHTNEEVVDTAEVIDPQETEVLVDPQETEPRYQTITVGDVNFRMVRIEGGTLTMGATAEQGDDARDDEYPTHWITLSSYWIGETEVTQQLWEEVIGSNPSEFQGYNLPVERVSYDDVEEFIQKLNQQTGLCFRLPTEAEWEYAARGGQYSQGYKYSGSNKINEVAWYFGNSNNRTHPVGQKEPNELGLYDMSGNVWEWCSDWYGDYSDAAQTDPRGPASGTYRVLRGGGWGYDMRNCYSSRRSNDAPDDRYHGHGFRLALSE